MSRDHHPGQCRTRDKFQHRACLSFCPWSPEQWASSCFSSINLMENFRSHLKQKKENGDFPYTYRVSPTHLNWSSQHVQVEESHTKGDRWTSAVWWENPSLGSVLWSLPSWSSFLALTVHNAHTFFSKCVRVIIKMGKAFLEKWEKENVFELLC